MATRLRRGLADIDYLSRQPLGRPEAVLVIWAGMRGAVTVAAAQLLPSSTPHRPLLIFVAFLVAILSLLMQGGTVGLLVSWLWSRGKDDTAAQQYAESEHDQIRLLLEQAGARVGRDGQMSETSYHLAVCGAKRIALLDARDDGVVDAEAFRVALMNVDVDELVLRLRGTLPD
jgi:CPA1 family monovalent cation:H+ antiporter